MPATRCSFPGVVLVNENPVQVASVSLNTEGGPAVDFLDSAWEYAPVNNAVSIVLRPSSGTVLKLEIPASLK